MMYEAEVRLSNQEAFCWSTSHTHDQFDPNNKFVRGYVDPIEITGFCPQNFVEQQ